MSAATPRPWVVGPYDYSRGGTCIDPEGSTVPVALAVYRGGTDPTKANAELIVRCVNSHDQLIAALEGLVEDYEAACGDDPDDEPSALKVARAALAAARETTDG